MKKHKITTWNDQKHDETTSTKLNYKVTSNCVEQFESNEKNYFYFYLFGNLLQGSFSWSLPYDPASKEPLISFQIHIMDESGCSLMNFIHKNDDY